MLIMVIAIATTNVSYAQILGVRAGLNLSNMLDKDDEGTNSNDFKMKPGFNVGPTVEFPINEMFSFESGLLLSTKGFKYDEKGSDGGETYEYNLKSNLLYLDIPLTGKAYFDVKVAKIYGALGPYIGIGLSGKVKSEDTYMGQTDSFNDDIKWGSDQETDDLKRLDYGLTIGAGVLINSIQIGLTYDLGFANISAYTDGGAKTSNRVLALSVGYKFDGK